MAIPDLYICVYVCIMVLARKSKGRQLRYRVILRGQASTLLQASLRYTVANAMLGGSYCITGNIDQRVSIFVCMYICMYVCRVVVSLSDTMRIYLIIRTHGPCLLHQEMAAVGKVMHSQSVCKSPLMGMISLTCCYQ